MKGKWIDFVPNRKPVPFYEGYWTRGRANTVQVQNRLFILDGVNPLRYVDLTSNKVVQYKPPKKFSFK